MGLGTTKDGYVHYFDRGERYTYVKTDQIVHLKYVQFIVFNDT